MTEQKHEPRTCENSKPCFDCEHPIESGNIRLYYHKTSGGAEYLMDTFIEWEHNGKSGREGRINDQTKYVVRIDGDITKDAELNVVDNQ